MKRRTLNTVIRVARRVIASVKRNRRPHRPKELSTLLNMLKRHGLNVSELKLNEKDSETIQRLIYL